MLDQNTTTIITTIITILGTLGGVILGVILSNRYVAKQEKAKRDTTIIEEVYTLIGKIDNQIGDDIYDIDSNNILKIKDNIERMRTLIHLYLSSVRKDHEKYSERLWRLLDMLRGMGIDHESINPNKSEVFDTKIYTEYEVSKRKLMEALEKLVQ